MSTTDRDARDLIDCSANQLRALQFALAGLNEYTPSEEVMSGLGGIIDDIVHKLRRAEDLIVDHLAAAEALLEERIEARFEAERKKRRGDDMVSALEEMRDQVEARVENARKEGYAEALRLNAGGRPIRPSRRRSASTKAS